jgi:predicted permease
MLTQTVRRTLQTWRRAPVWAVTAMLTLALGVGANTAIFSVVHAVLFRPLPYPAPDRLVEVFETEPKVPNSTFRVSLLNYLSWSERTKSFQALAVFQDAAFNVIGDTDAERAPGILVTASLFRVLALAPLAGRELRADDETPGSRRVAVIARSLWQRRYAGDPSVIGRTITLNGESHEIVGVVPDAFRDVGRSRISSLASPQLFLPLTIDPARENRGNHTLRAVGRLAPSISLEQAGEEMRAIASALEREFPRSNTGWGVRLERIDDSMIDRGVRPSLLALLGAVGMLLLIACANVSNLVLASGIGRQRELALRAALGAEPRRLLSQLLIESLCLAVVSGVIGIGVSVMTVEALRSLLPPTLPRIAEVRVDTVVLGFGLLVSLCSGVLFGILPAMRASRVDPLAMLTHWGRALAGPSRSAMRQGLVVVQVALATALLLGASLLLQSFVKLQRVPLGFDPQGVSTARVSLPRAEYPDAQLISRFYQRLLQSIGAHANVSAVAVGSSVPFTPGVRAGARVAVPARQGTAETAESFRTTLEHIVSDDYFRALAIPILAGRAFDQRDRAGSAPALIVSQSTARQLWPDSNPVGQQIERNGRVHEVVGVVGDVRGADAQGARGGGLDRQPVRAVYLSATQFPQAAMTVVIRTAGQPSAVAPAMRAAVRDIDPAVPIDQGRALDEWLTDAAAQPRLTTTVAAAVAGIALLLVVVGIYGVVSYAVGLRTQEIGLRMAVGATRRQILGLVLRDGMASAVIGAALGLGAAALLSRLMASLLFEVRPDDPLTFVSVPILVAIVVLLACYVPARRATRVDPLAALRCE